MVFPLNKQDSPFLTYRTDGSTVTTPIPIYDQENNRVGVVTGAGPIFAADPRDIEEIKQACVHAADAEKAFLAKKSKESRNQRMTELLDLTLVSTSMTVDSLDDITLIERRIIELGLRENSCSVTLPYAVNCISKRKEMQTSSRNAIEVAVHRAARRLYNRGLATVEKGYDGLIWCTISKERLHAIVTKKVDKKLGPHDQTINLIKVHCEIPTFPSGEEKKSVRTDPLDMPRRASEQRLAACRLLSGVRMLERPDKVEINYHFDVYSEDVNSKIIALLDVKTGEVIGSEYSTRFNDIAKAARNLDKFDLAVKNSFNDHGSAVFLTLTTDPNLTDGERKEVHARKLADTESKLKNTQLPKSEREKLEKKFLHLKGPDFEIEDLTIRLSSGTLSKDQQIIVKQRIAKLESDKKIAVGLHEAVRDPNTPIRTKEKMVTSLKKMNRWEYKHDPNGFQALWDANRHFGKAWNRFMTYLTKNNDGIRPKYIATYEFTETGLMHVHALIFTEWLLSNDQISREWIRCGQGEISYIYGLKATKNRTNGEWEWRWKSSKNRPKDTKGMSGGDYLKKYVKKCLLAMMDDFTSPSEIQSLYWAFNKRFFTNSRKLLENVNDDEVTEKVSEAAFVFFKICHEEVASDYVDRMVYHRIRPGWEKEEEPPDDIGDEGGALT